jgi:RimJ/RimL family protein N-acetyltransferase
VSKSATGSEFWGRGLATEAGREALQHGFEHLGLQEIVAFTLPANKRSRRVMEKLGLVFSEEFESSAIRRGSSYAAAGALSDLPNCLGDAKHEK